MYHSLLFLTADRTSDVSQSGLYVLISHTIKLHSVFCNELRWAVNGCIVQEVGWDSSKPGYDGLVDIAKRLLVQYRTGEETERATVTWIDFVYCMSGVRHMVCAVASSWTGPLVLLSLLPLWLVSRIAERQFTMLNHLCPDFTHWLKRKTRTFFPAESCVTLVREMIIRENWVLNAKVRMNHFVNFQK